MSDRHSDDMNWMQDHVDLVCLLAERVLRLHILAAMQVERGRCLARVICTILDLLSFFPGAQRLVRLLDEWCCMLLIVPGIVLDIQ